MDNVYPEKAESHRSGQYDWLFGQVCSQPQHNHNFKQVFPICALLQGIDAPPCRSNYIVIYNQPKFIVFQIFLSTLVGPYLLLSTLNYWVYPMKDYIGETGCHMVILYRNAGILILQIQSLCVAIFRYICLFHNCSIWKINFSPYVSIFSKITEAPSLMCVGTIQLLYFHEQFPFHSCIISIFINANSLKFGTSLILLLFRLWQS